MEAGYDKCSELLQKIKKNPEAKDFLEPVPWKEWELFDYPKIIKHQMDLGTVEKKLTSHEYKDVHEFAFDMRLIWKNCMTYNAEDSEIYQFAKDLQQEFEEGFAAITKEIGVEDIREVSLVDKQKFTSDLYSLSSEQLGKVVQILDEKCPQSLVKDKTNPGEIEIIVDEIDSISFHVVSVYINDALSKK